MQLNDTHEPALTSWVPSANAAGTDFPIQNLPFCVFRPRASNQAYRAGVAIGDQIVDMAALGNAFDDAGDATRAAAQLARQDTLNALMRAGPQAWSALRLALSRLLRSDAPPRPGILVPQSNAEFAVPAQIGDYTDFYTSIYHATAVGKLFRPDQPLLPNYKWVPIGYHGRSSTIGISGDRFHRPLGQVRGPADTEPRLAPSVRLDYEMEVGIFIGGGNVQGEAIPVADAEQHIFGLCLLNDWSARDLQAWEYQPLGPFLSKNFATTISPWIVTLEALAPYRSAWTRDAADPQPLPYLDYPALRDTGGFDVALEVLIETNTMRRESQSPARLSLSNFRHSYWSVAQLLAHHTVNGCAMRAGDLLGSGTQSGPDAVEAGSLLELTAGGKAPLTLPNGEQRVFIEDGDRIVMRGWASAPGRPRIGFGEVSGTVLPAR